jgi:hypothetical protein
VRITFTDKLSARTLNEGSSVSVIVKCWDDSTETWTAQTPTNVYYRLDGLNGSQITDWTSVTPAASVTISLTGGQNAITDDCNEFESKQLTVMANRGIAGQYQDIHTYRVRNLSGQT